MKVLMIDNYDSFTYNLVHYLESDENVIVTVWKNDEINFDMLNQFDRIVISPGPGLPEESGEIIRLIQEQSGKKPILGICMGHQAIGIAFGAELKNLNEVLHGVSDTSIQKGNSRLFENLDQQFEIGRYHSWVIDKSTLSNDFKITLKDEKDEIMAMEHKKYDLIGLQFHPESVLTPDGFQIIQNWLNINP